MGRVGSGIDSAQASALFGSPVPACARASARRAVVEKDAKDWENEWKGAGGAEGVMVAEVLNPKLKKYEGQTIAAIAKAENRDPRDVVIDIVIADRANAYQIMAIMDVKDVRTALASPIVSFGTDSQGKGIDGFDAIGDIDVTELFYAGERTEAAAFLADHGWYVRLHENSELYARYRLEPPVDGLSAFDTITYLTAVLG